MSDQQSVHEEPSRPPRRFPVTRRLLIPLVLLISIFGVGSAVLLKRLQRQHFNDQMATDVRLFQAEYEMDLKNRTDGMAMTLSSMVGNERLVNALASGDAELLQRDWFARFEVMNREYSVSRMSFIDPQQICLLRLHKPEKRGDFVGRLTLQGAARNHRITSGIELGSSGDVVVRVVAPVYRDTERVGFVELGQDVASFMEMRHRQTGLELVLILDASRIVYTSMANVPAALLPLMGLAHGAVPPGRVSEFSLAGRDWRVALIPFTDVAGKEIGHVLLLHDVTDELAGYWDLMLASGGLFLMLLVVVLTVTVILVVRTDISIRRDEHHLQEKQQTVEVALVTSEMRLRSLLEAMPAPVFYKDMQECYLWVNPAFEAFMGLSTAALAGKSAVDICPPHQAEIYHQQDQALFQNGSVQVYEEKVASAAKGLRDVLFQKTVMKDQDGALTGLVGVMLDITEQKQMQQHLQTLSRAIEQSPITVVITDPDGAIEYANPYFEHSTGYTVEEAIGKNPRILKSGEMPGDLYQQLWETLLAGREWHGEFQNKRKDGSLYWESAVIAPVRDAAGKTTHYVAVKEEITRIKQAAADLQKMNQALESTVDRANAMAMEAQMANIAKSEFLANMSHEIRTPMNGIIGMNSLLMDTPLTEDQRHYVQIVQSSSEVLLALLNDILDLSKIESGRFELASEVFVLKSLLQNLIEGLEIPARVKGVEVRFEIAPDVPPVLFGDAVRLRQVLTNLVGNAVKFTEKGRVEVQVKQAEASASELPRRHGNAAAMYIPDTVQLVFAVRDTGIGIAKDKQHLLFTKFSQVDGSMTRKYGGTGLGLAISKQLVELMGGQIGVQSPAPASDGVGGPGAVFSFTLAFKIAHETEPDEVAAAPEAVEAGSSPLSLGGCVLVAEDNVINQQVAVSMLTRLDVKVDCVANGRAALEAISKVHYDLVLMDVQMPVMDGLAATEEIRRQERAAADSAGAGAAGREALTIIAMTANAMQGDRQTCLAAGINDYISKPLNQHGLYAMLKKWMGTGRQAATEPGSITEVISVVSVVPTGSHPIWDLAGVLRRLDNNKTVARVVTNLFIAHVPDQLTAMEVMVRTNRGPEVARQLHSIKGACANVGAEAMCGLVMLMETEAFNAKWGLVEDHIHALRAAFSSFCGAVEAGGWMNPEAGKENDEFWEA